MTHPSKHFPLAALSLACTLLAGCGGGDAEAPPSAAVNAGGTSQPAGPDTVAPTMVSIANNVSADPATGAVTFTFVFSEDVGVSFTADDVTVTGGTKGAFERLPGGTQATLVVTPTPNSTGSIAVSVAAGAFADLAGNANSSPATAQKAYDTTVAAPPPVATGTALATFDETPALPVVGFNGAEGTTVEAGPAGGGTGKAIKILRAGGDVFAGAFVTTGTIPFTATSKTITAKVFSPKAGVPMVVKVEGPAGATSGDTAATTPVVAGWQTLTWNFNTLDLTKVYNNFVMLPDLGTVSPVTGESYYFDDITLGGVAAGGAGGATGGGTPGADMGSFGPVTIPVATANDGIGFILAGDAIFASDYAGTAEPGGNLAAYANAVTAGPANGGNIGYFNDPLLDTSAQKLDLGGWVSGSNLDPAGIHNFFRFYVLTGPASTFASSFLGLYVNSPSNGTVDVSTYGNIKFKLWGPAGQYEAAPFVNPAIEIVLAGPKVAGCTTGSGGTEITKTFTADQHIGAGSTYKVSLAGWSVKGTCGADTAGTAVQAVLSKLARVAFTMPAASFNFSVQNSGTPVSFSSGINLGPVAFTNL